MPAASSILLSYQERLVSLHAAAVQWRSGQMLSLLVMILALVAIGVLGMLAVSRRPVPLVSALLPVPIVIYAAKVRKQRSVALLQTLRLEDFYKAGVDRLENRWAGAGIGGEEFVTEDHAYARDLQVVGVGSLFELLCTCRTDVGRRRLAQYLLNAPTLGETRRRQEAVRELQGNVALREQLQLLGDYAFQESKWATIQEWLDAPVAPVWNPLRAALFAISLAMVLLFVANLMVTALPRDATLMPFVGLALCGGALAVRYRERVIEAQPAVRALSLEIGVLRQGLRLLETQRFQAPLLTELVGSVSTAASHLRTLERLSDALRERDKEWFYHLSRALCVGTQVFLAIEVWRARHCAALRRWLAAWGEFEALMAIANYAFEHPGNSFPDFADREVQLACEDAAHPLLASDVCVRNTLQLGAQNRFYIVSGSNMAGKSTLLRTVGLNAVLAYAGAPVCATRMMVSRLSLCASLSIQDSLLNGKSKFLAEIDRLKQALTVTPEEGPVLFLIDEILSGTNSKDRRIAAEAILRALLDQGGIGVISTHDLALTELATIAELRGSNVHMGSKNDADPLAFDYVLKPGVTQESSALAIARLAGVRV